jgi:hypothetical protein
MDRNRTATLLAAAALALALPAAAADAPRFTASGDVAPLGRSADGRFTASAEVRAVPAAASADGRFVLKATKTPAGGCPPVSDPLFSNGFEP